MECRRRTQYNWHTGGLLIWNANGMTMRNNVFKNNAIYDVLVVDGTAANWVIENNFFGWPVQPLATVLGRLRRRRTGGNLVQKMPSSIGTGSSATTRSPTVSHSAATHSQRPRDREHPGQLLELHAAGLLRLERHDRVASVRRKREAARTLSVRELCEGRFSPPPGISLSVSSRSVDARLRTDFDGDVRQAPRSAGADER